ncbi:MAG: hypothetical protein ACP5T3_01150 [Candidatus Micrarchaeia archaeon]
MLALAPGDVVEVSETLEAKLAREPASRNTAMPDEIVAMVKSTCSSAVKSAPCKTKPKQASEIAEKMWPKIARAAQLLLYKLYCAAPVIVRYHNDIDGASGAYALYTAAKSIGLESGITWQMHKGIAYSESDAQTDMLLAGTYESLEKPLLLITDFGTTEESNSGIRTLNSEFDIIWLDHHPVVEGFSGVALDHYINPWLFGGDSNFTAGFLASLLACSFGSVDLELISQASFIGDYSDYAKPKRDSQELAAILDLLTSDTHAAGSHNENLTPEAIESVLSDDKRRSELLAYANNRIAELLDSALSSVKVYKTGSTSTYVLDFEKIRNDEERYPLPGRFASKLMDRIEELNNGHAVVLLHFGHYISLRESKSLKGKLDLLEVLQNTKEKLGAEIQSGGGHSSACSIKLSDEIYKKNVIASIVDGIDKTLQAR